MSQDDLGSALATAVELAGVAEGAGERGAPLEQQAGDVAAPELPERGADPFRPLAGKDS